MGDRPSGGVQIRGEALLDPGVVPDGSRVRLGRIAEMADAAEGTPAFPLPH